MLECPDASVSICRSLVTNVAWVVARDYGPGSILGHGKKQKRVGDHKALEPLDMDVSII
jgi:hypothetical protein